MGRRHMVVSIEAAVCRLKSNYLHMVTTNIVLKVYRSHNLALLLGTQKHSSLGHKEISNLQLNTNAAQP